MDKLKFLAIILIFGFVLKDVVALLCWKNPYCFCSGRKTKTIYCRGVKDVSNIEGLLRRWTWTNKMRICGNFTTLPSRAFENFSVNFLTLGSPLLDENIPDDALQGVKNLHSVNLTWTRFRKIPQALLPEMIKQFRCTRGSLSEVDTELQNKTELEQILLDHNDISYVSHTAFYGTNNIQVLDLSFNKLSHLDPDTFVPLKFLSHINLKFNQLQTVDGLFRTLNPRVINLYGNNITSVEHAFHSGMWSMKILNLGGNPNLNLSTFAFNGSMTSLSELYMSDINLDRVDPYLLKPFRNLHKLYMNRDNLDFIPMRFFDNSISLNTLELVDNRLKSIDGLFERDNNAAFTSLKMVLLDGNELTSVSFNETFGSVNTLSLSRNRIETIKSDDFGSLRDLRSLNISWNGIRELQSESFIDNHWLARIDLTGSDVVSLNGSLINVRNLQYFTMRHSSLQWLTEEDFSGCARLRFIDLRNNSLSSVYGSFRSLKYFSVLDLSMNNLTTLTADSFCPFQRSSVRIVRLGMADNPWSCDCRLSWIVDWLAKNGTRLIDNPICSSPDHLRGRNISSLSKEDFGRWIDDCPDKCECLCLTQGEDVRTTVDCSRKGLDKFPAVLPSNVLSVDLQGNALDSFDGQRVLYLEELQHLNLEDNKIKKINLELPNGTSSVLLAGNNIRTLAQDERNVLESLSNITLSRNPWTCDCDAWSFRTWLIEHNDSVADLHEIRCGPGESLFLRNRPIVELTFKDMCSVLHIYTMIIIAGCTTITVIILLLIICYRQSICAWLYYRGCSCLKMDEKYDDPYDVFLMYSEEDEDLALGELAKGIEDERFLLCIPKRDVPAPRTPERVSAYLMQCSKVLVLLSRKFIENYDCMHLLKTALSYSLDSNARHLIFVNHADVPSRSKLDPLLAATMKSCRCLWWGERLFWQKLVYYLPKRSHIVSTERRTEEDEEPILR